MLRGGVHHGSSIAIYAGALEIVDAILCQPLPATPSDQSRTGVVFTELQSTDESHSFDCSGTILIVTSGQRLQKV